LERVAARNPDALATQLQILFEGALATALVRGDPALARSARDAAEVLLGAAGVRRTARPRRRSARRS
ncbi:MAG TPA: TetR family transcriptional regulator, partial [Burkholderiales bacterium]|nr:TetR family transcriptional regulator [Burkholderiales bacterium]